MNQGYFQVLSKTKELYKYLVIISYKSPKRFRFTLTDRMNEICIDALECILRANEINIRYDVDLIDLRLEYERELISHLRLLGYLASVAVEVECILVHQFKHLSLLLTDCIKLSRGWYRSDKKRFNVS